MHDKCCIYLTTYWKQMAAEWHKHERQLGLIGDKVDNDKRKKNKNEILYILSCGRFLQNDVQQKWSQCRQMLNAGACLKITVLHIYMQSMWTLSLISLHTATHFTHILHTRMHARTHARTHTHTHTFNGYFPGLPGWAGTRKVKPIWILLKQETVSGSGISWAIWCPDI